MSGGSTCRGTLRGFAVAADESGRCAAGLTAGAAAAWCRCMQESEGGTRRGTPRGFAAAADESGRRAAGLTAGAAAAWCRCMQESEGGTRRGTPRGFAAAADESGRRAAGLTAGAAAACVGACWRVNGSSLLRHPERGCCGGRRERAARCWPDGRRGCCLRASMGARCRAEEALTALPFWSAAAADEGGRRAGLRDSDGWRRVLHSV
jgi:hypothetical protein